MLNQLLADVPLDAFKLGLTLALALFAGLEREEYKQREAGITFGGVTTFPLIGLVSYSLALLSGPGLTPWIVGFAVVSGFMLLFYRHALGGQAPAGMTTEVSGLAIYIIGALVQREHYWLATTIAVLTVLLLELKKSLDGLARFVARDEIVTVAKFLVLAAVILPILPNQQITQFDINPFKTWLVVVAVSGVSFGSYALQRLLKTRGGLLLSAVLGGAYSSTVTTVALARQSRGEDTPNRFAGAIVTASAVMYLRLVALIAFFKPGLAAKLAPGFVGLALLGGVAGLWCYLRPTGGDRPPGREPAAKNPLELRAAFLFAAVFVSVLIVTHLVREHLGKAGLFTLAGIMGVTDVDPFILGLTQSASAGVSEETAAMAIAIAAASNNLVKAIYAYAFSDRATGRRSLSLLLALAVLGLVPLAWL